jgi:transglutaminase-like putative cysteine protease
MKAVVTRARHAHAWVEALMRDGSWLTLDATPAADLMQGHTAQVTWWRAIMAELERLWQEVTDFDGEKRAAWLQALISMPADHSVPDRCLGPRRWRALLPQGGGTACCPQS